MHRDPRSPNPMEKPSVCGTAAMAGTVYSAEVAQPTAATKKALANDIERLASAATSAAFAELELPHTRGQLKN